MAFSVQMPALGESVTEGTVTRWLKQEGDTVEVDEPLLEVSTDKVDTEIPSPAAGVLTKILAQEDDVVEVGGDLASIGDAGEESGGGSTQQQEQPAEDQPAQEQPAEEQSAEEQGPSGGSDAGDSGSGDSGSGDSGSGSPVNMPELGESVTEGTVTRWLKEIGDEVAVDEPLIEVSTDKVDTEIPSPVAGTLLEITAQEDDVVEVGGQLGVIGSGSPAPAQQQKPAPAPAQEPEPAQESAPAEPEPERPAQEKPQPRQQAEPKPQPEAPAQPEPASQPKAQQPTPATPAPAASSGSSTPYVTPLVRKLAGEHGVDLNAVRGTGVGGRIRKQDVLAAAEEQKAASSAPAGQQAPAAQAPAAPAAGPRPELAHLPGTTQKANRIRQITAIKTLESLQTTAQLTQTHEVDMSRIAALRSRAKASFAEREGVNLTYLPFFAKAAVEALKAHPNVNASYDADSKEITYYSAVHLGIAVDTEQGLLSPIIHNASDLSLAGLARAISDIADRARNGGLKPDELTGGTFTITNIGSQGALFDTPILVPPQSAMLGTGAIVERPAVVTDEFGNQSIGIRSMCYLPLTYDHRLVDGADAGRFVTTIRQRLEEGAFEADLGL